MSRPLLSNPIARRLFLHRHGLGTAPSGSGRGADLQGLVHDLGFVQVDSVNTVARAHDMILFSRRQGYRPASLGYLLERKRALFEHWTHDASVIPVAFFPHWRIKFARDRDRLRAAWDSGTRAGYEKELDTLRDHITRHGPVTSADVGPEEQRGSGGWWEWHPSKAALEYLWRSGELAICKRRGFRKHYDLTERVIPAENLRARPSVEETIDWACSAALDRLGMATSGELAAFWALISPDEAKSWTQAALAEGRIIEIDIACVNDPRPRRVFARPDLPDLAHALPPIPSGRVRILSPFDPALRNRNRTERLFGFHYRIEIFVPEHRRKYGYYVFPVLQGDRLIGRIDMKCDRSCSALDVTAFWPERGVQTGRLRLQALRIEIGRIARFTGCENVRFATDWVRACMA